MIGGVKFRVNDLILPNFFILERDGQIADLGQLEVLKTKYQSGDVVIVGRGTWEALQAKFAKDVTPNLMIASTL